MTYGGVARKLVLALKHGDRHEIARAAGLWMAEKVEGVADHSAIAVPVPLHWRRLIWRRFNQSSLLAQSLARHTGMECCPDALLRPRATCTLDGRSRSERLAILNGALTANPRRAAAISGRTVLIIDDVMTSGSTLRDATRACRAAGVAKVSILVLARVLRQG